MVGFEMSIDFEIRKSDNRAMKGILRILRLEFLPQSGEFAILVVRLWLGLTMLLNHGLDKLLTFREKADMFLDPLGVGSTVSLMLAVLGEAVGSTLLVLGLFTRSAALSLVVTMGVACFLVHGGSLSGERSGELAFIYLAGFLAILIAGPGRFSMDQFLFAGRAGK